MPNVKKKKVENELLHDKTIKTFSLEFTKYELLHLRDLFSVALPNANETVSQSLAALEERMLVESHLWQKLQAACKEAKIALSEKAPDYVVVTVEQPSMKVLQLATDPDEVEQEITAKEPQNELLLSGRIGKQ